MSLSFIEAARPMKLDLLRQLNTARRTRQAAVLVTDTVSGETRLITAEMLGEDPLAGALSQRVASGRSGLLEDGRTFLTVHVPPPRVVVIGAVHISQAFAPMAQMAGFDVVVIDPRTAFASPERFNGVPVIAEWPDAALNSIPLDPYTALAALTHDPKIDDAPIHAALAADCFYVGALGSRKTHAKRLERLHAAGARNLERIHAPIGLDIGAQSPAEIAVAILAEVIASLRRGRREKRAAA
jgi:xanthine dehydrogenase accessory factor